VVLVGVLSAGVLLILVFAYLCSAFLLGQFGIRRRILVGESGLPAILALNLISLILTCAFGAWLAYMSGRDLYLHAAIVAVVAQAVLLVQHLRFYHRDHLRVSYEN
jgi:multisubunit Na+/H+ antiporter MnhF subunit